MGQLGLNQACFLRQVGGKCEHCGYNKRPDILQFDHIIPRRKTPKKGNPRRAFPQLISFYSIRSPKLWDEFNKIQVLCPNCHVIKTIDSGENLPLAYR